MNEIWITPYWYWHVTTTGSSYIYNLTGKLKKNVNKTMIWWFFIYICKDMCIWWRDTLIIGVVKLFSIHHIVVYWITLSLYHLQHIVYSTFLNYFRYNFRYSKLNTVLHIYKSVCYHVYFTPHLGVWGFRSYIYNFLLSQNSWTNFFYKKKILMLT